MNILWIIALYLFMGVGLLHVCEAVLDKPIRTVPPWGIVVFVVGWLIWVWIYIVMTWVDVLRWIFTGKWDYLE